MLADEQIVDRPFDEHELQRLVDTLREERKLQDEEFRARLRELPRERTVFSAGITKFWKGFRDLNIKEQIARLVAFVAATGSLIASIVALSLGEMSWSAILTLVLSFFALLETLLTSISIKEDIDINTDVAAPAAASAEIAYSYAPATEGISGGLSPASRTHDK